MLKIEECLGVVIFFLVKKIYDMLKMERIVGHKGIKWEINLYHMMTVVLKK